MKFAYDHKRLRNEYDTRDEHIADTNLTYVGQVMAGADQNNHMLVGTNATRRQLFIESRMDWYAYDQTAFGENPLRRYILKFDKLHADAHERSLHTVNAAITSFLLEHINAMTPVASVEDTLKQVVELASGSHVLIYLPEAIERFSYDCEYPGVIFTGYPFHVTNIYTVKLYVVMADDTIIDYFFAPMPFFR